MLYISNQVIQCMLKGTMYIIYPKYFIIYLCIHCVIFLALQEHQVGNRNLVIAETNMKQTVYIYKCTDTTVQIKGKVNSIILGTCALFSGHVHFCRYMCTFSVHVHFHQFMCTFLRDFVTRARL